jgi:hypothetical protein
MYRYRFSVQPATARPVSIASPPAGSGSPNTIQYGSCGEITVMRTSIRSPAVASFSYALRAASVLRRADRLPSSWGLGFSVFHGLGRTGATGMVIVERVRSSD